MTFDEQSKRRIARTVKGFEGLKINTQPKQKNWPSSMAGSFALALLVPDVDVDPGEVVTCTIYDGPASPTSETVEAAYDWAATKTIAAGDEAIGYRIGGQWRLMSPSCCEVVAKKPDCFDGTKPELDSQGSGQQVVDWQSAAIAPERINWKRIVAEFEFVSLTGGSGLMTFGALWGIKLFASGSGVHTTQPFGGWSGTTPNITAGDVVRVLYERQNGTLPNDRIDYILEVNTVEIGRAQYNGAQANQEADIETHSCGSYCEAQGESVGLLTTQNSSIQVEY